MTSPIPEARAFESKPPRASAATLAHGAEKRTWFGRFLRVALEPAYYWLDLRGSDGRPSFTKVTGVTSFAFGIGLLFRLWAHFFGEHESHTGGELAFLLAFSFLVFCLPYGIAGLKTWSASRQLAGAAPALAAAAKADPERLRAQAVLDATRAKIAERRTAGGDDFEVTD